MTDNNNSWVFIVNPVAGNGSAKTILPKLENEIRQRGLSAEIVFTERKGHATELSESYFNKGFGHIIGVGGDGTINETARPLLGKKGVILGIIPAGTGNDFIQILGFPDRFGDKDWEKFFNCKTTAMDTGSCNGMIFLNGMGLGFDAQVAAENYTEEGEVKPGGKNKYIWHIVKTLLFFRERKMNIISDKGSEQALCFMNTVSIGRRFAGDFYITPLAIANDGLLDVCMVYKLSLPHRLKLLLQVPKGKHVTDKKVNYYLTSKLQIEFSDKVPFHVDGELNFSKEFNISLQPSSLNIIYNPDGKHFFR
jgi:diacylglycerol kinase (ATP)